MYDLEYMYIRLYDQQRNISTINVWDKFFKIFDAKNPDDLPTWNETFWDGADGA